MYNEQYQLMLLSVEQRDKDNTQSQYNNPTELNHIFYLYYKIIIYTVLSKNMITTNNISIYLNNEDIVSVDFNSITQYLNTLYAQDCFKHNYKTDIVLNDLYRFVETAILNAKKCKNNIYFSFMSIGNDKIMVAQQQVRRPMQ